VFVTLQQIDDRVNPVLLQCLFYRIE